MATLEDIVAASKILSEDSEIIMSSLDSKMNENRVRSLNVRKDDGGSVDGTAFLSEGVAESETVAECTFDGGSGLERGVDGRDKDKAGLENLSGVSFGRTVVGDNGIDVGVDANGSKDGVFGSDGDCKDGEGNGEGKSTSYKQLNGNGRDGLPWNVDGKGKGDGDGEKLSNLDNVFRVGDLVWGKIRSHPWWPGQVCDPKDASEFAMERKQEGRLLVAFFGDGSCSWCLPSQLIPFVENFLEMTTNGNSQSFSNAVQRAVDEVGRLVESEMICKCIPEKKRASLVRPVVANAGLEVGVLMPEVDFRRLSIPKYEPIELLKKVKQLAKAVSVDSSLDLAVLISWLSAFYYFKGGYHLPAYNEPLHIEGLEDKNKDANTVGDDFSVPIEVPILGPREDVGLSSPRVGTVNSESMSESKVFHKRKQKSVAELMGENKNVKPETRMGATVKEGADFKSTSSQKRKKKNNGEGEGAGGQGASLTRRKRKAEVSESPKITNSKVSNVENGDFRDMDIEIAHGENISGEAKEETEEVLSPRERKKSKYLSPPYTNLKWRSSSFKAESKVENDQVTKISTTDATGDVSTSRPVTKSVNKVSEEKLTNGQLERLDISVKNGEKMTFPASDVDAQVSELLSEMQLAAVDHLYLSKEGSLDMVWSFVSAFRSSTYLRGSDYKIFHSCKTGGKRKSLTSQLGDEITQKETKSSKQSSPKSSTTERKSDKAKKASGVKSSSAEKEGKRLPCLILAFSPEFPLPSKKDILKQFRKFGSIDEKETKVVIDSHSVEIVYRKGSDAEAAFKSSLSQGPFGSENVTYRLQHSSASSRSRKSRSKVSSSSPLQRGHEERETLISDVGVIKQKIEIMTAIMENYHSKFSAEEKCSLKDEMKQLLEKVETISEKVRVLAESSSS